MKLYPPILKGVSVRDLFVASKDPTISISYSPFGPVDQGGTVYVKTYGSPYAKGVHIAQPSALARFSRSKEKGVAIVNVPGKGLVKMPRAAADNLRRGKRGGRVMVPTRGGRTRGGEELGF